MEINIRTVNVNGNQHVNKKCYLNNMYIHNSDCHENRFKISADEIVRKKM